MEALSNNLLDAALANSLAAVQLQVKDWNQLLKSNYQTSFDNWSQSVLAGRIDNSNPPRPPKAYVVGHFTDSTLGPEGAAPNGNTPIQWACLAQGTDPVCPLPTVPPTIKPYTAPVLQEPDYFRIVPPVDAAPVDYRPRVADSSVNPTPVQQPGVNHVSVWLKGLLAALAGGAIASAAQAAATGNARPSQLKTAAITGAALTLGAYLTQSPVGAKY